MPVIFEDVLITRIGNHYMDPVVLRNMISQDCVGETASVGSFVTPVNAAEPSPDGRWLCALVDMPESVTDGQVLLLPEALDYLRPTALALEWPSISFLRDVGAGSRGSQQCQYAAWSPDSRHLAVSSDTQTSVAVWEIALKSPDALEPEKLGRTLYERLVSSNKAQRDALKTLLPEYLWSQIAADIAADDGGREPQDERKGTGSAADCDPRARLGQDAGSSAHRPSGSKARLAVLQLLSDALWDQVSVKHIATYDRHQEACLALQFVPGMPGTLAWVEKCSLLHVANIFHPGAHHVVHLNSLPLEIKHEQDCGGAVTELSDTNNWGIAAGGQSRRIRFDPPPPAVTHPHHGTPQLFTHAFDIFQEIVTRRDFGGWDVLDSLPASLVFALARGAEVEVPESYMRGFEILQEIYKEVHDAGAPHGPQCPEVLAISLLLNNQMRGLEPMKVTGLSLAGPSTVVVSTERWMYKVELAASWEPVRSILWPLGFRRAAIEILLIAAHGYKHVCRSGGGMGSTSDVGSADEASPSLFNLPTDVIAKIVEYCAGDRCEWLNVFVDPTEGRVRVSPTLTVCGMTDRKALSTEIMNFLSIFGSLLDGSGAASSSML